MLCRSGSKGTSFRRSFEIVVCVLIGKQNADLVAIAVDNKRSDAMALEVKSDTEEA